MLAAAAIEQCGWKTLLTPMEDIDLVAMFGTRFMRVQVKASTLPHNSDRAPHYYFTTRSQGKGELTPEFVDIFALVAVDRRRVIFASACSVSRTTRILPENYDQIDIERITWDNAVTQILGELHGIRSGPEVSR